ncbi:hypothetical protein BH09GEM1_BH09GEM1_43540 [soil metagenome]
MHPSLCYAVVEKYDARAPLAAWFTDSLGVIHVHWGTGFTGYAPTLSRENATTLRGRIVANRDFHTFPPSPDPEASAIARRRECSAIGL